MKSAKTGRNEPCPCGSGKKYKQCCAGKTDAKSTVVTKWIAVALGGLILIGALSFAASLADREPSSTPRQVWSPEARTLPRRSLIAGFAFWWSRSASATPRVVRDPYPAFVGYRARDPPRKVGVMEIDKKLHGQLGASLNGEVWALLEKSKERSEDENRRMVHAAHASHYHWLHAGTGVHQQRGEWLISHVYAVLGLVGAALRHAQRCAELTEIHRDALKDFDLAYSVEALARAHALTGNRNRGPGAQSKGAEIGRSDRWTGRQEHLRWGLCRRRLVGGGRGMRCRDSARV